MTPATRVVADLLVLRPGERLAIVHDDANREIALAFEHAAQEARAQPTRLEMEQIAPRPWTGCPRQVLGAISSSDATLLAAAVAEGEYDARLAMVGAAATARARHIHMVGVSRRAFVASMASSTARVFDLLRELAAAIRPSSRIRVASGAGTRLEVQMAPHLRWFQNGSAVRPGEWMTVPYGALVSSPASVRGVYVADGAVGGTRAGSLAKRPVTLRLEAGRVVSVECRDLAMRDHVARFVAEGHNRDRVGLVGLGANIGIVEPLGEITHDENMPGVHLSLGEPLAQRTHANWSAHGQLAFAAAGMDVELDGVPLVRQGRYLRFV